MGPRASWSHLLIDYIPQVCYQVTGLAGFLITFGETKTVISASFPTLTHTHTHV